MADPIAIIDCGTNTFHLLIVKPVIDGQDEIILKEKIVVKIGEGGINDQIIVPAAENRALSALKSFSDKITAHNATKVFAFATSAFRNARNGEELKQKVKLETGIDINIIPGDQEASFIFEGVKTAMPIGREPVLVMDIGGGSVEFIIGNSEEVLWKESFELGAQRLLDLFHNTEPISKNDLNRLESFLLEKLASLLENIKAFGPNVLIGSSGTFDTLSDIYCAANNISIDENASERPLTIGSFKAIFVDLVSKNREERLVIPGMIEMRVDMIVVASALIEFLLNQHPFNELRVSTYALKEGVLSLVKSDQM
ncbi:exopolyphosphatase [Fulvivirga sp. RKSG066]|uniref:Ppx/GppA phosphatase family protein n=1 Tax=Fulvivirga aurantia TaxID=2529383 RepID=UPI0012BC8A24|nr:exopolyphosphatase [Fulvivirga aurantia]MTI22429.1 exopolyphosphatase [Fulvivirga aurantia]